MFARLRLFTRTSIWRFTLVFAALVLLVCGLTLATVFHFTIVEQRHLLEQRLPLAIEGFINLSIVEADNPSRFVRAVKNRARSSEALVLALDYSGSETKELVGNLSHFPANVPQYPNLGRFPIAISDYQGDLKPRMVLGARIDTAFGPLLVGLFDTDQKALENRFLQVSLIVMAAALFFTLVAGFLFNWRVMARLNHIGQLVSAVQSGELDARLPVSTRQDEYDMISQQINQMLDDIDGLMNSVSSVTDSIAHDLRTPLSHIRIRVDEKIRTLQGLPQELEWCLALQDELDNVIETFNAMLELSRLEKGVSHTESVACDLEKICRDVTDLIAPIAEDKLSINLSIEQPATLEGDPNLLFRAVYNVLDNAVRYTPEGGEITVEVNGRTLIFADSGPGIAPAEREKVFQRLYRVDKSRQRQGEDQGFGLGLAIVKAIVLHHGGRVRLADNSPGLKVIIEL